MRTAIGWAVIIGIVFSVLGLGEHFAKLASGLLAIVLVGAAILLMLNPNRGPGEVIGPVVIAMFAVAILPPVVIGILQGLSWGIVLLVIAGVLLAAMLVAGWRR